MPALCLLARTRVVTERGSTDRGADAVERGHGRRRPRGRDLILRDEGAVSSHETSPGTKSLLGA
jgi:hypothetical protein